MNFFDPRKSARTARSVGLAKRVARSVVGEVRYQRLRYKLKVMGLRRRNSARLSRSDYANLRRRVNEFWKPYGIKPGLAWHELYLALHETAHPERFIPEDLFFAIIEPALNRLDLSLSYVDKNRYDALFQARTPFCHLRNINGAFYDHEYRPLRETSRDALIRNLQGEYVVKPSLESGGGNLVRIYSFDQGSMYREDKQVGWSDIERTYGQDYLIQDVVRQHAALREINASSVNTLRMVTLRTANGSELISAVLRIGRAGSRVDNWAAGGYACGIRIDDGSIKEYGIDKQLHLHRAHSDTGSALGGGRVPGWDAARRLVEGLHDRLHYFDIVSWDIAIGEDEVPILIELNLDYQEINIHQGNNGPLFGEHTTRVLERVFNHA